MNKKLFCISKITAAVICMLALAEHSPEYVTEIWHFIMLLLLMGILGLSVFDSISELEYWTKKERSGRPSNRALN